MRATPSALCLLATVVLLGCGAGDESALDTATSVPFTGQYGLTTAGGRDLPATTDTGRPGCELQLVSGDLFVTDGGTRFRLRNQSREACGGEVRNEATHEATGRVERAGDRLELVTGGGTGTSFGRATGTVDPEAGEIVLTSLESEDGSHDVEWRFTRLHDIGG